MTWSVRSLRLTLFPAPGVSTEAVELRWEELTGTKPANTSVQGGLQLEEGPFPPGRLLLQKQLPLRLDILLAGDPPQESAAPVTLGPFGPASETLRTLATKPFERGPYARMALGVELVHEAEDRLAAYRILVQHIRSAAFKLEGGKEFLYQINRVRPSRVLPPSSVNRITRWHASSWQAVALQGGKPVLGKPYIAAVITTDFSTDEHRTEPLPRDKMADVFAELRGLTTEIHQEGDVA